MNRLKVSAKLIVSSLVTLALSVIIGIGGVYGITTMIGAADSTYRELSEPLGDLTMAVEYFQRICVQMQLAITYSGISERLAPVEEDLYARFSQFEEAIAEYGASIDTDAETAIYHEIMNQYRDVLRPGVVNALESAKAGLPTLEHMRQSAGTMAAADTIAGDLSTLVGARMKAMQDRNAANDSLGVMLRIVIVGTVLVSAALSMILAFSVAGKISKPLTLLTGFMDQASRTGNIYLPKDREEKILRYQKHPDETGQCIASTGRFLNRQRTIAQALETVAGGNLTVELDLLSEQDVMGASLRKMVENLNGMFGDIQRSSAQVTGGSKQIADGAVALVRGSREQSEAVGQLSASVSAIAEQTKNNADLADQANALAQTIKANAEKGSVQMGSMTDAVKEINEASRSISKVIKVIDDIAFQTNILALNAAVEAARAGQHGKGFAVVAEEVRSLASKSAEAAKDTGSLIANSMEKAQLGARIADETSASLADIVAGINQSSHLVSAIAQSSEEQTQGIVQINHGIDQVARVIRQNSDTAAQSAAAGEQMSGQANLLEDLIAQFRLKDGARPGPRLAQPSGQPPEGGYGKY